MIVYLLDTSFILQFLGARFHRSVISMMLSSREATMSAATAGELFEHAFRSPNPSAYLAKLRDVYYPIQVLPYTEPIAERFAEVRAFLRRQGQPIPDLDVVIAATALYHDLTLVTLDRRHFARIPNFRLYEFG